MRSSFLGLEASKRSIQVSQKALDITSNNLSNAGTEGYARQRLDVNSLYMGVTNSTLTNTARISQTGQGVSAYGVSQTRDEYLDKRYRETTCFIGEYDTKASVLSEIETIFDNVEADEGGLANALDTFKTVMSTYATNSPDSEELSTIVRNQAYNIATMLRTYDSELNNVKENNVYELETSVGYVNGIVDKIIGYNKDIVNSYAVTGADKIYNGDPVSDTYGPNELLDARNQLIDELSYYGNISVSDNANGSVKIMMGENVLLDDQKSNYLIMRDFDAYNAAYIEFSDGAQLRTTTGDLKAYKDLLNGNGPYATYYQSSDYGIPYYKSAIDAFAQTFADLMNETNGCTTDDTSRAMFGSLDDVYDADGNCTYRATITAANIKVSEEWMKDSTMIGETYNEDKQEWTLDLNGKNANKLLLGMDETLKVGRAADFEGSVYDYVLFLSNRLGQNIEYQNNQYDVAKTTASELLNNRDAVMGVSDTEEGINMMTYQKWFNASSRMMTTLDDCLNTIINSMGRVGL